jgi:hypothetical protein
MNTAADVSVASCWGLAGDGHPRAQKRIAGTYMALALLTACSGGDRAAGDQQVMQPADNVTSPVPHNVAAPAAPKHLTRAQLREKAKTDPDGADAQAIDQMSRNELVATTINSAGFLCARVTNLYPSGDDIITHCVEYRSGAGRVSYRINPGAGSVEQID